MENNIDSVESENEEQDLLSDHTSETSYFIEENQLTSPNNLLGSHTYSSSRERSWKFTYFRWDGRVLIGGEWTSRTESRRLVVIGPDWPCVVITYLMIIIPSVFIYLYLLKYLAEYVLFYILFISTLMGLTTVFLSDPGLLRKFHHARSRKWTFCDHCQSFRPPKTVHCSTCQVCVANYDHHCPWTGKCIGSGNLRIFQFFVISLTWLIILFVVVGILVAVR